METALQPAGRRKHALTLVLSPWQQHIFSICRVLQHGLRFQKVIGKSSARYVAVVVVGRISEALKQATALNFQSETPAVSLLPLATRSDICWQPVSLSLTLQASSLLCADHPNRMSIMKSGTKRFPSQPGHLVTPFGMYILDTANKKGISSSVRGVPPQPLVLAAVMQALSSQCNDAWLEYLKPLALDLL
jgi:hypothetical protein